MKRRVLPFEEIEQTTESAERYLTQVIAMWSAIALLLTSLFASAPSLSAMQEAVPSGAWARYKMLSTYTYRGEKVPLDTVTLRVGPMDEIKGKMYRWWQMQCEKTDGGSFSIRVLSQKVPMINRKDFILDVARYILKEGEESPLEYVNSEEETALLPLWSFKYELVPCVTSLSSWEGPFAVHGKLLGQMLVLWEWSAEGEFPSLEGVEILRLDPGLMIGTGRNFRDTLDQRITGSEDYPYRRFVKEEYEEMIEAGISYFRVDPEQAEWVRRRPVFYEQADLKGVRFPEILYRSNYWGAVQFVDEPACYIYGDDDAKKGAKRPSDLAELLRLRVRRTLWIERRHYSSRRLEQLLRDAGFALGSMQVYEPEIPIWETLIQTSFYQIRSQPKGIVHEGRYRLEPFRENLEGIGSNAEWVEAREMLLFHYAFLRGAARAALKVWSADSDQRELPAADWGMSIYGQADPEISPLAVTLAYDLGARYIWYWTSDHQHHLPYREQLELTRHLRAHQKAHPRRSRKELLKTASVAIAIPYGYVIDFGPLWASNDFAHDKLNEAGVPYGAVVKAAVKQALSCLKKGDSFDFVVECSDLPARKYERIVHVHLDGTVTIESN